VFCEGTGAGQVYVFTDPSGTGSQWTQQAILSPNTTVATAAYGFDLAAIEGTLVVAARGDGSNQAGRVYVYVNSDPLTPAVWELSTVLVASNGKTNDRFGASVAIESSLILVGASNAGGYSDVGESDCLYFNWALLLCRQRIHV
jgi:hypothetical protein